MIAIQGLGASRPGRHKKRPAASSSPDVVVSQGDITSLPLVPMAPPPPVGLSVMKGGEPIGTGLEASAAAQLAKVASAGGGEATIRFGTTFLAVYKDGKKVSTVFDGAGLGRWQTQHWEPMGGLGCLACGPRRGLGDPMIPDQSTAVALAAKSEEAYQNAVSALPLQRKLAYSMLAYRYANQARDAFAATGDAQNARLAAAGAGEANRVMQSILATARGQ